MSMDRRGFLRLLGLGAAGVAAIGVITQHAELVRERILEEPQYLYNIDAEAELTAMLSAHIAADVDRNILYQLYEHGL